jgi:phage recombination protein Bet
MDTTPTVHQPNRLEFTSDQIELIKNTVAATATDDELKLFLYQCRRTKLDPLAKQIYCVFRWADVQDPKTGVWKKVRRMSIQTAIDGFRLIAERTGHYAGQLGPEWCGPNGGWQDVWLNPNEHPAAARIGVLRKDFAAPLYSVADWKSYVQTKSNGQVFSNWTRMGPVMIAKCAEALSLRRAFPQELSGLTTDDEMPAEETEERVPIARPDVMREKAEPFSWGPPGVGPAEPPPQIEHDQMPPMEVVKEREPEPVPVAAVKAAAVFSGTRTITEIKAIEQEARDAADHGTAAFQAFWRRFRKDDKQVAAIITGLSGDLKERMKHADEVIDRTDHEEQFRP